MFNGCKFTTFSVYYRIFGIFSTLSPKLFFSGFLHFSLTLRTGFHVPYPDVLAAAVQAKPPHLAPIRWGYVGDDAANYNVLNGLAVRTIHWGNLLSKEATPFVHLGFIPTSLAAIFQLPCHLLLIFLNGYKITRIISYSHGKLLIFYHKCWRNEGLLLSLPNNSFIFSQHLNLHE
jgi:hypothetical protein